MARSLGARRRASVDRARVERETTVLVKAYERPDSLRRLVASIRSFYPRIAVLVVDDSEVALDPVPEEITRYLHVPFDTLGLSGGRNFGLRHLDTPYVLITDDDMVFERRTDLGRMLWTLETTRFGIVAGRCLDHDPWRSIRRGYARFEGSAEIVDGALVRRLGIARRTADGLPVYDVVAQFFMARVDTLGVDPWDESLAVGVEHVEFFFAMGKRGVLSTMLPDVVVRHHPTLPPRYHRVRARRRNDSFLEYAAAKGITDKVVEGRPYTIADEVRHHLPSAVGYYVRRAASVMQLRVRGIGASDAKSLHSRRRTLPRRATLVAASALAAVVTFVVLPEALGDRPYDPKPSRLFKDLAPLGETSPSSKLASGPSTV